MSSDLPVLRLTEITSSQCPYARAGPGFALFPWVKEREPPVHHFPAVSKITHCWTDVRDGMAITDRGNTTSGASIGRPAVRLNVVRERALLERLPGFASCSGISVLGCLPFSTSLLWSREEITPTQCGALRKPCASAVDLVPMAPCTCFGRSNPL
jgi:hypothetical protein